MQTYLIGSIFQCNLYYLCNLDLFIQHSPIHLSRHAAKAHLKLILSLALINYELN